jgi:hypothetical protein
MVAISMKADIAEARKFLTVIQRDQLPFATAKALTATAFNGREKAQADMALQLDRPTPFTVRGVQVERAIKEREPTAAVFIEQKRYAYLRYQIEGGVRRPKRRALLIGMGARNRYGNTPRFRNLRSRLLAQPRYFEAAINGTSGVWERVRGGSGGLRLALLYASEARYRAGGYRFEESVLREVARVFVPNFDRAIERAIATAKRRTRSRVLR